MWDKPAPGLLIYDEYEAWLVALSVMVAIFTSSVALETARHIRKARSTLVRHTLLLVGSFALGGGVWAMHFIGMVAFKVCGASGYDIPITLFSMLPSVFASLVALRLLSADTIDTKRMLVGGLLIGLGIGTMHYSGMAAMRISSQLNYDPLTFGLSIIVAVALSVLGVWTRFGLVRYVPDLSNAMTVVASGCVLGAAISGMHYVGMAAAIFVGDPNICQAFGVSHSAFLAIAIAAVTVFIAASSLGLNLTLRQRDYSSHLQRERQRQNAIINTVVDGMIMIDEKGTILEFNPACETMFGYKRLEAVGRNISMLMPDPYQGEHDGYLSRYLVTGERKIIGSIGREVLGLRRNGIQFPLEISVSELIDGTARIYVGVLRDITERKQMEKELHDAIEVAETAAEVKSAFLTNMSHEIRTPMNAIIGYVEIALSLELAEEQRRNLTIVHRSARSLLRLLNDILDTAKLDQRAVQLEIEPFNLNVFLDEVFSIFRSSAKSKDLGWHINVDQDIAPCYLGDVTRIR